MVKIINFINIINTFFDMKIFIEKDMEKIEYLLDFINEFEKIKISALKGDKIIDFFIYEYIVPENGVEKTSEEYDNKRQIISTDDNFLKIFEKIFEKQDIKEILKFNTSNPISKDKKTAFIEALYYEIYNLHEKDFLYAIKKIASLT